MSEQQQSLIISVYCILLFCYRIAVCYLTIKAINLALFVQRVQCVHAQCHRLMTSLRAECILFNENQF